MILRMKVTSLCFRYVRALGAFYMRLVGTSMEIYKYLEPLYNDSRKMKRLSRDESKTFFLFAIGVFTSSLVVEYELLHMDEFIDELLREERVLDIQLPRLQKRSVLEENDQLEPRKSVLEDDIENESSDESEKSGDEDDDEKKSKKKKEAIVEKPKKKWQDLDKPERSPSPRYARSTSPRDRSSRKRR
jgi:pre-mRNA-splicing factor 38A